MGVTLSIFTHDKMKVKKDMDQRNKKTGGTEINGQKNRNIGQIGQKRQWAKENMIEMQRERRNKKKRR